MLYIIILTSHYFVYIYSKNISQLFLWFPLFLLFKQHFTCSRELSHVV